MKADQLFDVRGNVSLVTGAADGLGRTFAEVLAANGAHVALADIDGERLQATATAMSAAGGSVETHVVDVADCDRLSAMVDEVAGKHGRLDSVFANAGISAGPGFGRPEGEIVAVKREAWDRVLHINLTSVFVTIQAAARHMKPRRAGRIVCTASIAGLHAEPPVGYAYAATKAAVVNLVRQAALELAPHGVSVNAICPGPFLTNIGNGKLHTDPAAVKMFTDLVPMGRLGQVDEIKGLALLLASPAASYLTGAAIPIDGGSTA